MNQFRVHPRAKNDLDAIYDYLADKNPAAADGLLQRLEETFRALAGSPLLGQTWPDLGPETRGFTVDNYVVFYPLREIGVENEIGVEVIRVIHGARDILRVFFRDSP